VGMVTPQSGDLTLQPRSDDPIRPAAGEPPASLLIPEALADELWLAAGAENVELSRAEFVAKLTLVGRKHNWNLEPGSVPSATEASSFFRSLHLSDLTLAHACALGRDAAWQRFVTRYQAALSQTALTIANSATLAHDLAESLYSELFGLAERNGQRNSPLEGYSGRGPLIGWLRAALIQKHANHHRRTHREVPLGAHDITAPPVSEYPSPSTRRSVQTALETVLRSLSSQQRFLLSSYFIDQRTLAQIALMIQVHEATVSRKLKRLTTETRKNLLKTLQSMGLSKRAAEEALGIDPRDLTIDLRTLLQSLPALPFIGHRNSQDNNNE